MRSLTARENAWMQGLLSFCVAAGLLTACTSEIARSTPQSLLQVSVTDAEQTIVEALTRTIDTLRQKAPFQNVRLERDRLELSQGPQTYSIRFHDITDIRTVSVYTPACIACGLVPFAGLLGYIPVDVYGVEILGIAGAPRPLWSSQDDAKKFADALYVLKNRGSGYVRLPSQDAAVAAAFDEAVKYYRSQPTPPQLPEDARRHKIQAETAVRQKRYMDAIRSYDDALRIAPWWPDGYYNRALLSAEEGVYREAIGDMKKYLQLEPTATDARTAQDKIYEWEGMESKR